MNQETGIFLMAAKPWILRKAAFLLGIVCLPWILYDLFKLHSDLPSVIFRGPSGLIVGVGYLFILIFHVLMFIVYGKYFRHHPRFGPRILLPALLVASFFALAVEKVMFDEVGREYFLEFPRPGEADFIDLGLFANAVFIAYALSCLSRTRIREVEFFICSVRPEDEPKPVLQAGFGDVAAIGDALDAQDEVFR